MTPPKGFQTPNHFSPFEVISNAKSTKTESSLTFQSRKTQVIDLPMPNFDKTVDFYSQPF